MGITRCLLVLSLVLTVGYAELRADSDCLTRTFSAEQFANESFDQVERQGNLERFCQEEAAMIRAEHFWCRGYLDANGTVVENTASAELPTDDNLFWTIFLQYPVLSWMDVLRKDLILSIIREIVADGDVVNINCGDVNDHTDFCVYNVETYAVTEYRESVLVVLYNLGLNGEQFNSCFENGMENNQNITTFRGADAFRLTLNVSLMRMFERNIGPASSIGVESEDPTLRPVILGTWGVRSNLSVALPEADFVSNPNPINYGLEAGDIVFAVFGSILLVIVAGLILLGFFIHPFFLS